MSRKHNELDLEQLMRSNRPTPPPPPLDEYDRILAAATKEEAVGSIPKGLTYVPWILAATFVIALAATLLMDDGRPTTASRARDDRMEAFLSDTLDEVVAERTEPAQQEPFNVYDSFLENGANKGHD